MKRSISVVRVLFAILILAMFGVVPVTAQSNPPSDVNVRLWLYAKADGSAEVGHNIAWTETSSRDQMDVVCDCTAGNLGYSRIYINQDWNNEYPVTAEDVSQMTDVFHVIRLHFAPTQPGVRYQMELGYGSVQNVFYAGYDDQGRSIFEFSYNPWPFPVKYDVFFVSAKMPQSAGGNVSIQGNWDSYEEMDPPGVYPREGFSLHMVRNAAANEPIVVRVMVPPQYFGQPVVNQPAPQNSQPENNQPNNSQPEQPAGKTSGSPLGGFVVVLIIICILVACGVGWYYLSGGFSKPKEENEDDGESSRERATGTGCYTTPVIKREGSSRITTPSGVAKDLTLAEVAALTKASDYKIVIAAVRDLEARNLVTIAQNKPLKLSRKPRNVAAADSAGKLTNVDNAVLAALLDDNRIDTSEQDLIVAAVKASLQMKLAQKDKAQTRDYYEERIRALEQQVRAQRNPTVYVERNNDIWFWLWLNERYDNDSAPRSGTYVYPTPSTSVYVSPTGDRLPVNNDTFKQSVADFAKPKHSGVADEISRAASRAAGLITGAAAGSSPKAEPNEPKPHDACVVRPACVTKTPHDACVSHDKAHDACVSHDKAHDACVSHDKAHDACVHSNCHTHSACVHSNCHTHSACVSRGPH